ncbi:MAG: Na/Pi cotransporter family protein [Paludibacteraceae bacterium]|nr:Na/Pi cotransporter family protein [Paludibacteraceae bacterium]
MDATVLIQAILQLIAGIGIFLVACQMMSSNLETASSARLKSLFSRMSNSRMLGVGIGTVATAAIQSSGATTVMVIGFVNVGIMSLAQAATIIYGANIGTTVTAQIVALGLSSGGGISTTVIFAAFAGLGAFIELFSKKDIWKTWGGIITGFGMLFVGLSLMSGSMKELSGLQEIKDFLASIEHPLMLVLFGAILTAIVQSSSVVTSIALTMAVTGLISLNQGIYLTMGSNIGSCVVAIIAGLTSGLNAKRTALIHLLFNCFGVFVFLIAAWIMHLVTSGAWNYGVIFETIFPGAPQLQLAMFHTIFNCVTVCIILPLTDYLVNLVCNMLPEKARVDQPIGEGQPHFHFVDDKMLRTPIIAVNQVKLEIENMAAVAIHNFNLSMDVISKVDFSKMDEFKENEQQLNYLNRNLIPYIVQLNNLPISEEDHRYLATAIRTIGDLERIGDYAVNVTEYAELLKNFDEKFSADLLYELEQLRDTIGSLYQSTMKTYMDHDFDALIEVNRHEDQVDEMVARIEKMHLQRLMDGIYPASVGQVYQEFASDVERIADHFLNVAKSIRQLHVGED